MKLQLVVILCFSLFSSLFAQTLKPYTIGAETTGEVGDVKAMVIDNLKQNGIMIIGQYTPVKDTKRALIAITSGDLKSAVKKIGGFTGFAAALRVAVTKEGDKIIVSYTTPQYWGNAYFRDDYPMVESQYNALAAKLAKALSPLGEKSGTQFGSEKGLTVNKLRSYKYMLGMPKFKDNIELNEFASFTEAKEKVDGNFKKGLANLRLVYTVEFPDQNIKLYGVGLEGPEGETNFMPTIDGSNPKHTAFLPYEMLILDNKVYMLHGRFRIALSFPDLTMGTFMKIVSTPKDILKMLKMTTE